MLTIATFFWQPVGFQLPSTSRGFRYGHEHVRILQRSISRNLTLPHRFVCITDDPIEGVDTIPMWSEHRSLGGCFCRLKLFSPEMREILGDRFAVIDLDCVVVGSLDSVFGRSDSFVMNSYPSRRKDQHYNGSLMMMDAGARPLVWSEFSPPRSIERIRRNPRMCVGTDQAWVRLCLGKSEARFTEADGVYDFGATRRQLPSNARLVFFSGPRDPSEWRHLEWVRDHWQ